MSRERGPAGAILPGPSPASGGDPAPVDPQRRRVFGYGRLSPGDRKDAAKEDGRADVGVGIIDQQQRVEAWCTYKDVELVEWVPDVDESGATLDRPGIRAVMDRLDAGAADALVAARLDRLVRSTAAFAELLERAERGGWSLVVLDFDLDTSTAAGRLVANVMVAVVSWQRDVIVESTKAALKVKRAQGVRMGRPPSVPPEVVKRIRRERARGRSLKQIADGLDRDQVPTGQGGKRWYLSTVRAVLHRSS